MVGIGHLFSDGVYLILTLILGGGVQPSVGIQSLLEGTLDVVYHHGYIALGCGVVWGQRVPHLYSYMYVHILSLRNNHFTVRGLRNHSTLKKLLIPQSHKVK